MKLDFNQHDCIEWAVAEIIDKDRIEEAFKAGTVLRVKLGIDPTSSNIHIGRSMPLWRLRAFQELGHEIHLVIGDYTGQIGDTSDKESERPMLSPEVVKEYMLNYEAQLWQVLNPEKRDQVFIHYNSTWLEPLSLAHISEMADAFSVNQFVKRELIARRLENGSRISLREMLYPLMQGYDSIVLKADVELGGTDQRFNMLAGRLLQERTEQRPQAIIMHTLIKGLDGRKMSSSWGNVISLRDTPTDKFGKMMTADDNLMADYLLALPRSARPFTEAELKHCLEDGENPRDLKMILAETLVALYHGDAEAEEVRQKFIEQFSHHIMPESLPEIEINNSTMPILDLLSQAKLIESRTEGRRLIEQGGVRLNQQPITETTALVEINAGSVLQVGKRKFVKLILKND